MFGSCYTTMDYILSSSSSSIIIFVLVSAMNHKLVSKHTFFHYYARSKKLKSCFTILTSLSLLVSYQPESNLKIGLFIVSDFLCSIILCYLCAIFSHHHHYRYHLFFMDMLNDQKETRPPRAKYNLLIGIRHLDDYITFLREFNE